METAHTCNISMSLAKWCVPFVIGSGKVLVPIGTFNWNAPQVRVVTGKFGESATTSSSESKRAAQHINRSETEVG